MRYTLAQMQGLIPNATAGKRVNNHLLTQIGFDTRRIAFPSETVFFALPGKSNDGHAFINKAYQLGVRNFIVQNDEQVKNLPEASWLQVNNVLDALQQLAIAHRKTISAPIIGITGSNGKTVVKEWLYHLLKNDFNIWRSPRSYNSQIGVAISILGLEPYHSLGIIEAGISTSGEMERLAEMIQPSLAIFTHLGAAHDEGFNNKEEKALEKLKLFAKADVGIIPGDIAEIQAQKIHATKGNLIQWVSWGRNEGNKFRLLSTEYKNNNAVIKWVYRATEHALEIPFADEASVQNAMSCLCTLSALERLDPEHINKFKHLHSVENRLEFIESKKGGYLVNDAYSNDPDALEVALDFIIRQQPGLKIGVVLSDFEQSNALREKVYSQVAKLLSAKNVHLLMGVGSEISSHAHLFSSIPDARFFENTEQLLGDLESLPLSDKALLIKGSRIAELERVVARLQKQQNETVLEINLDHLAHNFKWFKNQLGNKTAMMAMVKAFGYGSGTFEIANLLDFLGTDYLAVAYTDEGIALREAGVNTPIMVMNAGLDNVDSLINYQLEPVLYSFAQASDLYRQLNGKSLSVHIEFDTGMHRLGFQPLQAEQLSEYLLDHPAFTTVSVFSHLAASEDENYDPFTLQQIQWFKQAASIIEKVLGKLPKRHILNTGGILRFPQAKLDMVRLGVGLYGVDPRPKNEININPLKPVAHFKTRISQIKHIDAGESVGYGRGGISPNARTIAILPVGYADGYRRSMGHGKGRVYINGFYCHTVGSICMDMCMVDVTHVPCHEGDIVELFGEYINVEEVAEHCNTIAYEILTAVSQRVKRKFTGEY